MSTVAWLQPEIESWLSSGSWELIHSITQILIKHVTEYHIWLKPIWSRHLRMDFQGLQGVRCTPSKKRSSVWVTWPPSLAPDVYLHSEEPWWWPRCCFPLQQLLLHEALGGSARARKTRAQLRLRCFFYHRDKLNPRNKPESVKCARKTCSQIIIMSLIGIKCIKKITCWGFSQLLVSFLLINTWHCINTQTVFYSIIFV